MDDLVVREASQDDEVARHHAGYVSPSGNAVTHAETERTIA